MVIAIDGTTASGKGTVARMLAKDLNIDYLDTGAIYRAIAVFFIKEDYNLDYFDQMKFEKELPLAQIGLESGDDKKLRVFLNGEDITDQIRDNRVSITVPVLAKLKSVQDKVHQIQHEYAGKNSLVAEGRETTSVVFPDADYKFYFDGDVIVRARHRLQDLQKKGETVEFETVLAQIKERDRLDLERELSPLVKVKDAIVIDGTDMTPQEMLAEVKKYIV